MCSEKVVRLALLTEEMEKIRKENKKKIEEIKREHEAALEPVIARLQVGIYDVNTCQLSIAWDWIDHVSGGKHTSCFFFSTIKINMVLVQVSKSP